jgi:nitrous oxide reductase accessory protein NosL
MKRRIGVGLVVTAALLVSLLLVAAFAASDADIETHRSCTVCGMDRKAYGFSRMLIQYQDGSQVGVCSLHCAIAEVDEHRERLVKTMLVADRDTRNLIDAATAVWVIGGKKRGVMTQNPKWAFSGEAAANIFIAANGGRVVSWQEAEAAARGEFEMSRR